MSGNGPAADNATPQPWQKVLNSSAMPFSTPTEPAPEPVFGNGPLPFAGDRHLDDLFGDEPSSDPSPAPSDDPVVDAVGALDDLFGDDEPADAGSAVAASALDDLFGEDEPAEPERVTGEGVDPDVADDTATTDEPDDVVALDAPDEASADDDVPDPAPKATVADRLSQMRDQMEAASHTVDDDTERRVAAARNEFESRIARLEPLYEQADQIIEVISHESSVQYALRDVIITNDPALDAEQRRLFGEVVRPVLPSTHIRTGSVAESETVFDIVYDEYLGLSVLGELWRDDTVTEILVDGWDRISVERHGQLEMTPFRFRSPEHAIAVTRQLSSKVSDRQVSPTNPTPTVELPGARVQFIWGTLSSNGLAVSIRKFTRLLGMDALLAGGSLTDEMADFLAAAVRARAAILVSGGTGTGKTTAINALSEFIPDTERVVIIENARELSLSNTHQLQLQAKTAASADDTATVGQEQLLVSSLRMRPDRIVVGEIREPSEAAVMLNAANTGHDGTMTTIHASSVSKAVNSRLSTLLVRAGGGFSESSAKEEIAQAFNLVVQISREYGKRFISDISIVDSAAIAGGVIVPEPVFVGEIVDRDGDPTVVHRKVGGVRSDTELANRFRQAAEDFTRWELPA